MCRECVAVVILPWIPRVSMYLPCECSIYLVCVHTYLQNQELHLAFHCHGDNQTCRDSQIAGLWYLMWTSLWQNIIAPMCAGSTPRIHQKNEREQCHFC